MAILRNDTTVRSADGQTTSAIITAANIGNFGVATTSTYYIGTTQNVFNRASGAQTLTGISIDGNAATVTNGVYTNTNNTLTGINVINNTSNTLINNLSGNLGLTMFQATAGTDAYMTFHIGGDFAAYLGLGGAENDLVYGGWSAGNNRHRILHSGNASFAWNMNQNVRTTDNVTFGTVTATSFVDGGLQSYGLRQYTIDLSSQSSTNFYPVVIDNPPGIDATWHNQFSIDMVNQGGGAAYNMHSMYGEVRGQGWTDQNAFFRIFHNFHDSAERSILGVYRGTQAFYAVVVYLRGGKNYYVRTNSRTVVGYSAAQTLGNSVFAIKDVSGADVSGTSSNISQLINLVTNPSGFYHSDNAYIGTNQVLHLGTTSSPNLSIGGNAATATTLQTARNINGTSFNGSAAITTATWGTARTLTIGSTGKSVDGSAAITWSLAEIGAAATNQTMFIGTTSVAINRASSAQTLTGISIDGNAATVTNGVYTTGNQTIAGIKTFSSDLSVNSLTVGKGNGNNATNSAFGVNALSSNSADGNSAFGYHALRYNTTGYSNTAVGRMSLRSNTFGYKNTAVGRVSLFSNSTGYANSSFGYNALFANTFGSYNTAVGTSASAANTIGDGNSSFGYESLRLTTQGEYNSAFGFKSLKSNTVGWGNSAFGSLALTNKVGGIENSAFGYKALFTCSSLNSSSAFGSYALGYTTTGTQNSSFGADSLRSNTSGSQNSSFGRNSGRDVTTGSHNSFFGYNTGRGITTGSNNTVIGSRVGSLSATLANNIIIADGQGNRRINVDSNGNVGINNSAPTDRLHVDNTIRCRTIIAERTTVTSSASTTIDTLYNLTELTMSASITTLTISNIRSSGLVHMWTIVTVGNGTGYSITWPAAIKWPGGTAPTITGTNTKRDIYQFVTYDGGTTIYAIIVGQNL